MANEKMRLNRTGASATPSLFQELPPSQTSIVAPSQAEPESPDDAEDMAQLRNAYFKEAEAPAPRPRATATRAKDALALNGGVVFLGKLGERLASERAGVRRYEALLAKHDAWGSWFGGPRRADLEKLRGQEYDHFLMLNEVLGQLGADPAAMMPAASLTGAASKGLPAALSDTRTNLRGGLEAILVAELADNDCWEDLSDLASALGHDDLGARFEEALGQQREHLSLVRRWLAAANRGAAGTAAADTDANEVDAFGRHKQTREKAASVQAGGENTQAKGRSRTALGKTSAHASGKNDGPRKARKAGKAAKNGPVGSGNREGGRARKPR